MLEIELILFGQALEDVAFLFGQQISVEAAVDEPLHALLFENRVVDFARVELYSLECLVVVPRAVILLIKLPGEVLAQVEQVVIFLVQGQVAFVEIVLHFFRTAAVVFNLWRNRQKLFKLLLVTEIETLELTPPALVLGRYVLLHVKLGDGLQLHLLVLLLDHLLNLLLLQKVVHHDWRQSLHQVVVARSTLAIVEGHY